MLKHTILLFTLVSFAAKAASEGSVDVKNNPESVISYSNYAFVTNLGATRNPEQDGDGYISKVSLTGELIEERFLPAPNGPRLDFPMGAIVISDVLYVVDRNRVVGFSVASREQVFAAEVPAPGIEYLNDITYLGHDQFAVSATNLRSIYILNVKTKSWSNPFAEMAFHHVNGLAFDDRTQTLFVAHNITPTLNTDNGNVTAIKFMDNNPHTLWTLNVGRFLDGLSFIGNNYLLASDWNDLQTGSALHYIDIRTGALVRSESIKQHGVADIHYDKYNDILLLPAMSESKVYEHSRPFTPTNLRSCTATAEGAPYFDVRVATDEFDIVRDVLIGSQSYAMGLSSRGDDYIWYRLLAATNDPFIQHISVQQVAKNGLIQVEIQYPREPDTNCPHPRLCDPSTTAWAYYICRR